MTGKLKIAQMATELAVALLGDSKTRRDTEAIALAKRNPENKDIPDALVLFDAIYDHISAKLTPQ